MTFLVRQLAPTDRGLPLEIYVFSNDQRWVEFEAIQADIFDYLFAAIHEFDLRPFQSPSGSDIAEMREQFAAERFQGDGVVARAAALRKFDP